MVDPFIAVHPNFLSSEECAALVAMCDTNLPWDKAMGPDNVWYDRVMHYHLMPAAMQALVGKTRPQVKEQITQDFGLTDPLYADTLQVVRWRQGDHQHPHADAENPDGTPHPFAWRAYASIIYLNDDFEGGEIYFPQHNLTPPIKAGTLAFFPGTSAFMHGVTPVTRGVRYTMASFFTFDASRHVGAPI